MQNVQTIQNPTLGVTQARRDLSNLVEKVQYRGDSFIINRYGEPAAAVVPVQIYENWKSQRKELFNLFREMQNDADLNPTKAEALALEAVGAVRSAKNKII